MATGYTMNISKDETFEYFVLGCARAFGALVQMKDDPRDATIPNEIKPSTYHKDSIVGCEVLLKDAKNVTLAEAASLALNEYDLKISEYDNGNKNKQELEEKYHSMLSKVNEWVPPSAEHVKLKAFMIEQITISIEHDCTVYPFDYKKLTPEEWMQKNIDKCAWNLGYHIKEWNEEVLRCDERTKWIRDLKDSLHV